MNHEILVCLPTATFGTSLAPSLIANLIERGVTGVCVPTGDPLILGQHTCCNCKAHQHLFFMVTTW